MLDKFMKAAKIKSEKEFLAKYPTEEDFFNAYPQFANGGSYTPVPVEKRNQWNNFIKYMREQGMSGSTSLDRGGNPTQRLLNQ
jgi:hypothetical protein